MQSSQTLTRTEVPGTAGQPGNTRANGVPGGLPATPDELFCCLAPGAQLPPGCSNCFHCWNL